MAIYVDGIDTRDFELTEEEIVYLYELVCNLDKYDDPYIRNLLVKLHCEAFGLMESLDFIKEYWDKDEL